MTTAAERLVFLSGASGLTAGKHLALLAQGATAGARLVAWSGLASATAGAHLMHDRAAAFAEARAAGVDQARVRKVKQQNELLLRLAATLVTAGILR